MQLSFVDQTVVFCSSICAAAEANVRWCVLCSEEERRWLAEAVDRHMMVDVVSRMREIALLMNTPLSVLEAQGITPDDIEGTDQLSIPAMRTAIVVVDF